MQEMEGCHNDGPFWGTLSIRGRFTWEPKHNQAKKIFTYVPLIPSPPPHALNNCCFPKYVVLFFRRVIGGGGSGDFIV